uniref:Uncharacterized protein n=1 Tax=Anguilla anguilla TaxID=7936 RepID=A0A0E9X542_ANGAN
MKPPQFNLLTNCGLIIFCDCILCDMCDISQICLSQICFWMNGVISVSMNWHHLPGYYVQ